MTTAQYMAAEREVMKRDARHRWHVHLTAFVLVNSLLLVVALIAGHPFWFAVPLVAWGVLVTFHYLHAVRWFERDNHELQGRIEYLAERMARRPASA